MFDDATMNRKRIDKLEGHVKALLTLLIQAYSQFLFLRPMLGNLSLITRIGIEGKAAGFERLREILYWSFIQELIKVCDDADDRTPSIRRILEELSDPQTLGAVENKYVQMLPRIRLVNGVVHDTYGPHEEEQGKKHFASLYSRVTKNTEELLGSLAFKSFRDVRHKLIAHNELRKTEDGYDFFDITPLKITYGQERILLEKAREVIDDLNSIVRNASFDWDSLLTSEHKDACDYWGIECNIGLQ